MNHSNAGFADGLLGRKAQSPLTKPDCYVYLAAFMEGQRKRRELDITMIIEREAV